MVPETLGDVAQQPAGVGNRLTFGFVDAGELDPLVILHEPLGGVVRVKVEARHGRGLLGPSWSTCELRFRPEKYHNICLSGGDALRAHFAGKFAPSGTARTLERRC